MFGQFIFTSGDSYTEVTTTGVSTGGSSTDSVSSTVETVVGSLMTTGDKATLGLSILAYRIICVAIIIAITVAILFFLRKFFKKYFGQAGNNKRITKGKVTVARVVYSVLRFVAILLAILCILGVFGVNVTAVFAGLGIAGAIGALSVQDLLKDLITGASIASDQYFAIGDTIQYEEYTGIVTGLSMRSTKIVTLDGSEVTIQNHLISKVRKVSKENKVIIPLSYDLDRKEAYALCDRLVEVISAVPNVESCKTSGIQNFSESSIDYAFLYYCDPMKSLSLAREVNKAILDELDRSGIEIPFNRLVIVNESKTLH